MIPRIVSRSKSVSLIVSAVAPASALLVVAIFAGFAIWGQNGLLALPGYSREIDARKVELTVLNAEQARLMNRKRLLQHGDADLADEMTRGATGMVGADEYVVVPKR